MKSNPSVYWIFTKRLFDVVVSLTALVLLLPVFLVIALLIKLDSPGPVFFREERIGKGFRRFFILKFRTLEESAEGPAPRFQKTSKPTRVGRFLRKTRLSELPQLINVLKGDMSIVGPRPELRQHVHLFRGKFLRILTVRPGITDLAAQEFQNEKEILSKSPNPEEEYINTLMPEKIRLAMVYLDRSSFFYDINLLLHSLFNVDIKSAFSLKNLKVSPQNLFFFISDIALGLISFYLAYFLRYEWNIPEKELKTLLYLVPFIVLARSVSYFYFRFYSRFWEYSSLEELVLIIKAVLTGSILLLVSIFLYSNPPVTIPRSVPIIDFILLVTMLGGSRLAWRMWKERQKQKPLVKEGGIRVLIFGAGDTGALLLKNLRQRFPHFRVCGFVDDNPSIKNKNLMGVKVLGNRYDIPELVADLGIREVLIAINNISSESLSELVDICSKCVVKFKIVSSVIDLSTNDVHFSKIRKIEISDLLGRDSVSLDLTAIKNMVWGKRVLVTGAGGSIGSELCQQIMEYEPSELVMLDRGENYLYELNILLNGGNNAKNSATKQHYKFCSITNKEKMDSIFAQFRPQIVFHAAAHKHVPLMEDNVDEAVVNNIYGTKLTADVSDKYGVERFVMVSTDKVIRPTSVMGTTKKVAEKYVQYMNQRSNTKFMTVRFGNVLGSKGSVIPFFQNQIENGGPVTVTHPEMTRYFMLIPEAVQLILQAAVIGDGGEIFVLEMGEPVKIVDLAQKMIRLAGYEPDKDIKIKFTGIRPGEKLFEELVDDRDEAIETFHKKIKVLQSKREIDDNFNRRIEELFRLALTGDFNKIKVMMRNIIGEEYFFKSDNDKNLTSIKSEN